MLEWPLLQACLHRPGIQADRLPVCTRDIIIIYYYYYYYKCTVLITVTLLQKHCRETLHSQTMTFKYGQLSEG